MTEQPRNETALAVPQLDLEEALRQHRLYLKACKLLLNDDDYAVIRGRKFRKRSGWAKLRKAFSINTEIVEERRLELDSDWGYLVTIRASHPSGRYEEADGTIMASELKKGNIEPTLHNVRSKALTRAKNRASSDILGAGVVSAEEAVILKAHWIDDPEIRSRFWGFARGTLKLTQKQVYRVLGVDTLHAFTGTKKDATKLLEEAVFESTPETQVETRSGSGAS